MRLWRRSQRAPEPTAVPSPPTDATDGVAPPEGREDPVADDALAPAMDSVAVPSLPDDVVAEDVVLDELSIVFGDQPDEQIEPDEPPYGGEGPGDEPVGIDPVGRVDRADRADTADRESSEQAPLLEEPGAPDTGSVGPASRIEGPDGAPPASSPPTPAVRPALIDPGLLPSTQPTIADADQSGAGHTIQIGDEDLPEIRYLDEELGSTSEDDGPIIIDDDDTADALVASDATGRGLDGRIRQRRIRVRRAEGRRRLQWVLIAAGVVVALIAVVAVLASSLFSVNQITVVGNRYSDPDALKAVIVELDGTPVLLVDTTDLEEQLEAIPWVEDARVRTSFPNSATIEIRERSPVAAMPGADGLTRVLDKEGRALDLIEGQPIALVWISGPVTLDIPAGHFGPPGPTSASALVPKLTPSIRPRVESMQVTPDGSDLRLYLRPLSPVPADPAADEVEPSTDQPALLDGPLIEVRFGSAIGDNEQIAKLVRLERILEDIGAKRVSVIDVSTAEVTVL